MNRAQENMFGGNHGLSFDDGTHKCVEKIYISHSRCITSICFVYGDKGVRGPNVEKDEHRHGGEGTNESIITLDYPREYLTKVSGHFGPVVDGGNDVIRSLTFVTNMRTYGPYGSEAEPGIPFSFAEGGGKILGIKGRSDKYLNAIGFHCTVSGFGLFKEKLLT